MRRPVGAGAVPVVRLERLGVVGALIAEQAARREYERVAAEIQSLLLADAA